MANQFYPKWKEAVIQGAANSSLAGTVKVALIDTAAYTFSSAHQFFSDLTGIVGTPATLTSKTFTNGTLDAADTLFPTLAGVSVEGLVLYIDTGTPTTSRLVSYQDSSIGGGGFTPSGVDLLIQWDLLGIWTI